MINFDSFELENGLQVFVIPDPDVQQAVINVLYNVGSRDEDEAKTGFAHLFEHLMFGGSQHIPSYDEPLQKVGGESNAFTSPDITNYYLTLPANNLETGFWLESDRMAGLSFDPAVLEVQRKVVIEEFKQRYLNQPYGDVWLKLRPAAYEKHPYKWATIGKDISHIEEATMEDVRSFFGRHYASNNAVMVVAGQVTTDEVKKLSEKWFGPIPSQEISKRNLPKEPIQTAPRFIETSNGVPQDAIYKVYHMPGRFDPTYHAVDLASDLLGRGKSSRLYRELVKGKSVFSTLQAYVTGSSDPGLLVISGHVNPEFTIEDANAAIEEVVGSMTTNPPVESALQKVKNQAESTVVFSEIDLLNQAMNLAFFANGGIPEEVNKEADRIASVTLEDVKSAIATILQPTNCTTLYYRSNA